MVPLRLLLCRPLSQKHKEEFVMEMAVLPYRFVVEVANQATLA